jgi:hypothetical protein
LGLCSFLGVCYEIKSGVRGGVARENYGVARRVRGSGSVFQDPEVRMRRPRHLDMPLTVCGMDSYPFPPPPNSPSSDLQQRPKGAPHISLPNTLSDDLVETTVVILTNFSGFLPMELKVMAMTQLFQDYCGIFAYQPAGEGR